MGCSVKFIANQVQCLGHNFACIQVEVRPVKALELATLQIRH